MHKRINMSQGILGLRFCEISLKREELNNRIDQRPWTFNRQEHNIYYFKSAICKFRCRHMLLNVLMTLYVLPIYVVIHLPSFMH